VRAEAEQKNIPVYRFEIVKSYPHDTGAFTQGLVFDGGHLYESTGLEGQSSLRRVEIATGKVLQRHDLARELFGEGLALVGDELIQITWKNQVAIVYDKATLREKRRIRYRGEGWGLTYDGEHLVLSDGTANLYFVDPATFRVVRRVTVNEAGTARENLNELEYVNGEVWANVWYQDYIARIDPKTGRVVGWIDLTKLWPAGQRREDQAVLNGIAHDPKENRLFVTGKNWPRLYEIRVVAS
jgi:glutamine cyclotransferase